MKVERRITKPRDWDFQIQVNRMGCPFGDSDSSGADSDSMHAVEEEG